MNRYMDEKDRDDAEDGETNLVRRVDPYVLSPTPFEAQKQVFEFIQKQIHKQLYINSYPKYEFFGGQKPRQP